jgi:hypothetical protein
MSTMSSLARRAGATHRRWLALVSTCLILLAARSLAQDAPKADERNKFDTYRSGQVPAPTPESKALFEKYAKFYVGRLNDGDVQNARGEKYGMKDMSAAIADLDRRLQVPLHNSPQASVFYSKLDQNKKTFVDEFGKVMITALESPALQNGKPIVRINAARMAAEVARSGYDGSAELFLKILAKPDESDAVKLFALKGLYYLFEIVPDPGIPEKTIFEKKNAAELPELERRCIQALLDFVFRMPEIAPGTPEDEVEALRYVRREAIRALARVRVQTVKVRGAVETRPALALLKAARGDGLVPPPNVGEIAEAAIGFCLLVPSKDRDMQTDYGVYHIGRVLYTLANYRVNNAKDTSVPWKWLAIRSRDALETWQRNAADMKLENAALIKALLDIADRDIFKPMEEGAEGAPVNLENLGQWLRDNPPKSPSLFKSDPGAVITLKD